MQIPQLSQFKQVLHDAQVMDHAKIFRELLENEPITQKAVAEAVGWHPSKLNRFLKGVTDLSASEFFRLLDSMPLDFQRCYWSRKLLLVDLGNVDVAALAVTLPPSVQLRIMRAIANSGGLLNENADENADRELVSSSL